MSTIDRADSPAAAYAGAANPNLLASSPETAGPIKNPVPKAMPMNPNARVRSSGFVESLMYACAMLKLPAVEPSMMREAKSIHSEFAEPRTIKPMNVPS